MDRGAVGLDDSVELDAAVASGAGPVQQVATKCPADAVAVVVNDSSSAGDKLAQRRRNRRRAQLRIQCPVQQHAIDGRGQRGGGG